MNKYRRSKLMYEVRHGNYRKVSELISAYGLSHTVLNGYVLLCIAIRKGYKNIAKLLLRKGAKIKRRTKNPSVTPLHLAAEKGYVEITKKLLDKGADIDAQASHHTPLFCAVVNRRVKVTKLLLNRNASIEDDIILHVAIVNGYEEIVKLLINKCAKLEAREGCGLAIFQANTEREYQTVINLLSVQQNIYTPEDYNYISVHYTVQCTNAKDARLFLKRNAHTFILTVGKISLYRLIEEEGNDGTVKKLLAYKYPRIDRCGDYVSALYIATMYGHEMIVKLLLQAGADVDIADEFGATPLTIAIEKGYSTIVEDILKYSPELNSNSNKSILNTAVFDWQGPYQKIVKLLLQYGAIVIPEDADISELLHAVLEKGYVKIIPHLLKHGVDVNAKRRYDNSTPLHIAIQGNHSEIVELLLDRGANVNATGKDNTTPLQIAVQKNNVEIVELLLNRGADVNAVLYTHCSKLRTSALHIAVIQKFYSLVHILLTFGADIDWRNHYGMTAFHLACYMGHRDMILLLLSYGCDVNIVCNMNLTPVHYYAIRCVKETKDGEHIRIGLNSHFRCYDPEAAFICIYEHIIKMKKTNLYLSEQNLALIAQELVTFTPQNIYENEMKLMKCTKIGASNVSFYDILTANVNQLAMYAKNNDIVKVLGSDNRETMFSQHDHAIDYMFNKGMKRKELQEKSKQFFCPPFINVPFKLPCICVDKILNYLSNKDLKVLINVCKSVKNTDA